MSTILVEARRDPAPGVALDCIAATCRRLGHDVFRWRGPRSGRVPHWRWPFPSELAILWNGSHPRYARAANIFRRRKTKLLFAELGWHPQKDMIQIDPQGINAQASWAAEPLAATGRTPLPIRAKGDLLVVLQLDRDSQITQLSPWFPNMSRFVEFICRHSALPVRVRAHPRELPAANFRQRVLDLGGVWDASPSLAAALQSARALACVNSSCGVEALDAGWPVLCYGEANYRHPGAVLCLDDDSSATRQATAALATGQAPLFREPIEEVVRRILARQWPVSEIDERLPALLEQTLANCSSSASPVPAWLAPVIRWSRDQAPQLLAGRLPLRSSA